MTDAIIFDMDGLLVDSERIWLRVEREMIEGYGGTFDEELMSQQIGMAIPEAARHLVSAFGLSVAPERFEAELVERVLALFISEAGTMAGAAELMEEALASPLPVAVASSSNRRIVETLMVKFGWLERLDALCTGDEVARGKPSPEIFLLAAERLAVEPARCVVLEDSLNGARAARDAGMRCIAVPNPVYAPGAFEGIAHQIIPTLDGVRLADIVVPAPQS